MDIQATKIELVQKLLSETSEEVLQKVKDILSSEKSDWWHEISQEEKDAIAVSYTHLTLPTICSV